MCHGERSGLSRGTFEVDRLPAGYPSPHDRERIDNACYPVGHASSQPGPPMGASRADIRSSRCNC
jgi:hypothetical protein